MVALSDREMVLGNDDIGQLEYNILVKNLGKKEADALVEAEEEELPEDLQELIDNVAPFNEADEEVEEEVEEEV